METGLPPTERFFGGTYIRTISAFSSWKRLLRRFAWEANLILEIVDEHDYDFASTQAQVSRLAGIEEASCNWSLFMVLDHLIQVDNAILDVIVGLARGEGPLRQPRIADYKPEPNADADTIENFQACARRFRDEITRIAPLRSTVRVEHPWFGPLNAHQWLTLAAVHHGIHRRQARKIVAVLGTT